MSGRYRIKTLMLSSGERLPVILDSSGQPLFEPTVYSLTEIRGRNRASNTIASALRSISVFFMFLDLRKIPLNERLGSGQILSLGEIEDLVRICRLPIARLNEMIDTANTKHVQVSVTSIEKHRSRLRSITEHEIIPASAATRLRYIRDYIVWMVNGRLSKHGVDATYRSALDSSRNFWVNSIDARLPSGDSRGVLNQREGLGQESAAMLLKLIDPLSSENPWSDEHSRYRNALIIQWLYFLGLRRGELLNIRISDIDFRKGTVIVARRADDPDDPRKHQPNVKTRAREIPLSSGLLSVAEDYIMSKRAVFKGARKHNFLFVSSDTGVPLSISSLVKIFDVLRTKCPDLPKSLSAHVLRHTWNERYSEEMDKKQVSEETEKKTRSYLMGWSETSGTAATYTGRHILMKAQKASLEMQQVMVGEGHVDE